MASNGRSTPEKDLSAADKEKLIKELKERLKEIERLKRELGMAVSSENDESSPEKKSPTSASEEHSAEDDSAHPVSTGRVAAELEELKVPALEMLDDKPMIKKKKAVNTP